MIRTQKNILSAINFQSNPNLQKKSNLWILKELQNINHLQKITNIGKASLKQGLPIDAYISNKSCDRSYVATKLQRVRSSGCVAPKKCGSIYHNQFTPINAFT